MTSISIFRELQMRLDDLQGQVRDARQLHKNKKRDYLNGVLEQFARDCRQIAWIADQGIGELGETQANPVDQPNRDDAMHAMVPPSPQHPGSRLIAAAPDLLAACKRAHADLMTRLQQGNISATETSLDLGAILGAAIERAVPLE